MDCRKILTALSDPTRRSVVSALLAKPQSVNDLGEHLKIAQYNASKVLGILREAGIVDFTQTGSMRTYRIADSIRDGDEPTAIDFGCCRFQFPQSEEANDDPGAKN